VEEALTTAAFTKKRIAPVIHKLLTSAVDNAKYLSGEQGTGSGRGQPVREAGSGQRRTAHEAHPSRADGRAFRYQRRLTHIVLSVAERDGGASLVTKVEEPKAAKAAKGKPPAKAAARQDRRRLRRQQRRLQEGSKKKKAGKKA
jgi:large subunit ribosomal protein L22